MPKLYIDMDGVIANFDGQENALGRFINENRFFQFLKPLPFLKEVNKMLKKDNSDTYILSASPNDSADYDKYRWIKKHMPNMKTNHIILIRTTAGQKKSDYCEKGDILIDDYSDNLLQWEKVGGVGIKMLNGRNSGKKWKGKTYGHNIER